MKLKPTQKLLENVKNSKNDKEFESNFKILTEEIKDLELTEQKKILQEAQNFKLISVNQELFKKLISAALKEPKKEKKK